MSRKIIFVTSIVACVTWGPLGLAGKAHAAAAYSNSKAKDSVSITITHTQIDRHFVQMMEGSRLNGYVPLVHSTQSGVTIAHGFDLGQYSLKEFNRMPIDSALKNRLRPYVGLKKYEALAFLKAHPLTITEAESRQLNVVAFDSVLKPLVKFYDQDSQKSFLELPPAAQTALFSFAYQNGPYFMKRPQSKQLWHCFITQDWAKASKQLRQHSLYISRRNQEASLLEKLA